jgi:hypothetical protein
MAALGRDGGKMYGIGRRAALAIFLIVGFAWQAFGDVTTCFGSGNCTVSTPSGVRQMNKEEALAHG